MNWQRGIRGVASPSQGEGDGEDLLSATARRELQTPHLCPLPLPRGEARNVARSASLSKVTINELYAWSFVRGMNFMETTIRKDSL